MSSGVFFVGPPAVIVQILVRRSVTPYRRNGPSRHEAEMCMHDTGEAEDK